MAAYHRVDDLPAGSAPGPMLGIEYGKAFAFTFTIDKIFSLTLPDFWSIP